MRRPLPGTALPRLAGYCLLAATLLAAPPQRATVTVQPDPPAAASDSPFLPVPVASKDTLRFQMQLGDFEARDLHGRLWRAADLRGRVTFVDIWAPSCGPCRQQHPEIQRFYDHNTTSNLQVLTFSMDEDLHRVESYMNERHYTFPVIVSQDLVERLFSPNAGVPQAWIVDRQGRLDLFEFSTLGHVLFQAQRLAGTPALLP